MVVVFRVRLPSLAKVASLCVDTHEVTYTRVAVFLAFVNVFTITRNRVYAVARRTGVSFWNAAETSHCINAVLIFGTSIETFMALVNIYAILHCAVVLEPSVALRIVQ